MGDTLNPPVQKTCSDSSVGYALDSNTTSVIVRNRSGTEAANINYGPTSGATEPKKGGADAIKLLPGDSIQLVADGGTDSPRIYYITDVAGETAEIEIIEFT